MIGTTRMILIRPAAFGLWMAGMKSGANGKTTGVGIITEAGKNDFANPSSYSLCKLK